MSDLERSIRDAARRHEPPEDWLDKIHARAHKKRRNQRLLAVALGATVTLGVVLPVAWVATTRDPTPNEGGSPGAGCQVSIEVSDWWRWEGSGADEVGGQDADLYGDATFAPGLIGRALALDGAGDFAAVPDDPAIDFGEGDFTIMLWVRFNRTDGEQVMLEDWIQRFEKPSSGWSFVKRDGRVALFLSSAAGRDGGTSVEVDIPEGTWVHLAVHRSGGKIRILINGEVLVTAPLRPGDLDSPSSLKFGHRGGLTDTPGAQLDQGFFLDGQIDEVMLVVDRALSPDEIATIYREQSACADRSN